MEKLFKSFWPFGSSSRMTTSYVEVIDILSNLRDSKADVTVTIEGDSTVYSSMVTALNVKHRVLAIDDLYPLAPLSLLRRGRAITIHTEKQGRKLVFNSEFLEPFLPNDNMGYLLRISEHLGASHPRESFRVLLDGVRNVKIMLENAQNQAVKGVVRNISQTGIGMKTQGILADIPTGESHSLACRISLSDHEEIACKVAIKNVQVTDNGETSTLIGGRILEVSNRDMRTLNQFISQLQRQALEAYA